ncbi:MarR family transcriptional regulator [Klenkia sp. PcliD-1-E]|uniref:MarR family transcriptional regulator n=1 Tax=Klenkia sp. PcliD-1-E TaxID=2954492 RepID=UPI002097E8BD|nr:MarR family transcriptional regulator [Klenkia sp. PcliD-1-E]MCO7222596.1 MarR family transcriptional regulator [Klenkia sp. PcliD-1-E]
MLDTADTAVTVDPAALRAARALHEAMGVAARETAEGLTPVQLSGLRVVAGLESGATVAQVAEALGVVASNASRLVDRLVAYGVVHRARARSDRREVRVSLSGQGRRLLERIDAAQVDRLGRAIAGLPGGERAALVAALGAAVPAAQE